MTTTAEQIRSLDRLDKRILLVLDENALSAKDICNAWALPESDEARIRYRIRERLGRGDEALVRISGAEALPGGINDRHIYSLTDAGAEFVRSNREELSTPESIDELREYLDHVDEVARAAGEDATDAIGVATDQRDRINRLQQEKCTINDRSKENRKRVQALEREVFKTEWDNSLSERIDVVENIALNRVNDIEEDLERCESRLRREFAPRSDLRNVRDTAQRASTVLQNAAERITELEQELAEERLQREELERRLEAIERALDKPRGLRGFFYE